MGDNKDLAKFMFKNSSDIEKNVVELLDKIDSQDQRIKELEADCSILSSNGLDYLGRIKKLEDSLDKQMKLTADFRKAYQDVYDGTIDKQLRDDNINMISKIATLEAENKELKSRNTEMANALVSNSTISIQSQTERIKTLESALLGIYEIWKKSYGEYELNNWFDDNEKLINEIKDKLDQKSSDNT